ncbi:glycosyltransferase [Flavobacterium degerlachei]|jgi:glycosyltransferase involved in cell wall biosynthesis|uniref:Glycosyltransferase involved in cell wall bisynthesis n=1 Tax=Flavobacterium degerlachei TaxID=229203 RepID=A0A1H2X9Z9_9FLAO|nr:glycosyltransferase [Flavobacterium degerlachei]SDW89079.1 Glycosyltransferase involved in cell wall bisynthesis [Flavobacterium degerlachei]
MKVLLVGEFSRLHNSLKEGLQELGHDVYIVGHQDGFKNYPIDFPIVKKWDNGILKKLKVGIHSLFRFDISSYLTYRQFKKNKIHFTNFDVVQLINENSFYCQYYYERKILEFLFKNNTKVFLLSSGYDFLNVKYGFDNPDFKSAIQPYLSGRISTKNFENVLKFKTKSFEKLHQFIYSNIKGIIATDLDYHIPLHNNPKYLGLIPNPINSAKIDFQPTTISDKIVIFHGINEANYYKKGNDYFEKALDCIAQKYGDKVEIITTRNVPYSIYINSYNKAHILLDQAYANDQGYNALEAMAKGKVVFTGAEKEFSELYNLPERVAINAIADVDYLVTELSHLIENPAEIITIGKRAGDFIEREHDYIKIASKYLEIWNRY